MEKAACPRDGATIFSDLIGKLDLLRVECPKCGRARRYRLADLITRYGRDEKVFAFTADITANCERKQARSDLGRTHPGRAGELGGVGDTTGTAVR
jgi:hypothetical protein